jgi:hypothetical protein
VHFGFDDGDDLNQTDDLQVCSYAGITPGDKPCHLMKSPLVVAAANDRIVMRSSDGVHFCFVSWPCLPCLYLEN